MRMRSLWLFAAAFLLCAGPARSQNVTGALTGAVQDAAGAVAPGVRVVMTNQATGVSQSTQTNDAGIFLFPSVLPGTYRLEITMSGFRPVEIRDVMVTANDRRTIGTITLQVGQLQEKIEVVAEITPVETASSERTGLITGDQMQNLAIKGRDFLGLMSTLPGVIDTNVGSREVVMTGNVLNGLHVNGGRTNSIMYALDGISAVDTGSNSSVHNSPNMDAIGEVKVLTSNYQAEYGRNSSGTINVIIKSGGQDFHGSAYWYYRHETLNANSFFNNRTGSQKPIYRFNSGGYSIGGPVYIPGKFNKNKDKLFFFWSQEFVRRRLYPGIRFVTTPTALQRNGDFSQTFDVNGALIPIRDPLAGANFPGNLVPKSRINAQGQAILNFFPLPNYTDPDPKLVYSRNYRSNISGENPRRQEVFRIDYNVTNTLRAYFRGIRDNDDEEWPYGSWVSGSINYDLTNTLRPQRGRGGVFNLTKVFGPSMVNELTLGGTTRGQTFNPVEPEKVARSRMGNIGQWYPQSNESGAIPNVTFGGVPNYINPSLGNIPYTNENPVITVSNNFSKLWGAHSLKMGLYFERMRKDEVGSPNTRGAFAFDRNVNNPLDANYAFANAILGNFNSYSEGTFRPYSHYRYSQVEWYLQDSWKAARRLTVEIGVRFYIIPSAHDERYAITTFDPALYDLKQTARLIMPGKNAAGKRVGVDPATGTIYPLPYIGLFVPGSGNYAPGMVVGGKDGYNPKLFDQPTVAVGPRIGLAWDVTGDGKTALRTGFGVFYDRPQGNLYSGTNGQPPVAYTPTLYFSSLDTFLQAQGAVGPAAVNAPQVGRQPLPKSMNFSFGLQRQVGWGTVVDASYVGSLGRSLLYSLNINAIPMYSRFDPKNIDWTTGSALQDNFFRPYYGLGNINVRGFGASSNYHSAQLAINRRMARGLQYGVSYTFSKALGVGEGDFNGMSPYFPMRQRNYGLLPYDRTHVFVVNYTWELPDPGKKWNNKALSYILGDWQVSGITSFISGSPFTPGFSTSDSVDLTGSNEGARITVLGDPRLDKGQRTFERNFKTEMFARTAKMDFGNAGIGLLRGPGTNNWDISVTKRVRFTEDRYFQFRTEFYNAWNHTQFSSIDTGARFDPAGKQINANFGAYNGARDPRRIQLSLRFMF
ncbi:MAG: TonB-dependent receptor [Bryobacteraceae bacterium]|nr:TonB-dependent receptor [Bryobacteraceae bacterium]